MNPTLDPPGATPGTLWLVPNTLDLGAAPLPLADALPAAVVHRAATLTHWIVEDARSARAFLKRVDALAPLARPLPELHIAELPRARKGSREPLPAAAWQALLAPALAGHDLGLLSDAGLPALADPGAAVVTAAHDAGLAVASLAGASAVSLAVAASGLNGQNFAFVGYLPQEPAARSARIRDLEARSRREQQTQVCIETPYRNAALWQALVDTLAPGTRLAVSVGLTLPQGMNRCAKVSTWRRQPMALPDTIPAVFSWLAS